MKSQELPMSTIVVIIIAIVAFAVLLMWYFAGQGKIELSTERLFNVSKGSTEQALSCDPSTGKGCPPGYKCCEFGIKAGKCIPIDENC